MTTLNIDDYELRVGGKRLLSPTRLNIVTGRRYGLIGKNGVGKTTLMIDLEKMSPDYFLVSQELEETEDPVDISILKKHKDLWDTQQEISLLENDNEEMTDEQLERYTQLTEEWEAKGYERQKNELYRILHGLGFDNAAAPVSSFSGGWRMRISLASALFVSPPLLLLDEPTNHLDLNGVIWLNDYLSESWKGTLVLVSHDVEFLDSVCTDIIHMYDKQLDYFNSKHACVFSRFLKKFREDQDKLKEKWVEYQKKLKQFKGKGGGKAAAAEFIKKHEVKEPIQEKLPKIVIPPVGAIHPPILNLEGVTFQYPGRDTVILKNVDLGIDLSTRYTIVGPNGVGKSTLMKLLSGHLQPDDGAVIRNRHLRVGYYHQHSGEALPLDQSGVSYVLSLNKSLKEQDARKWLGTIGLPGNIHKNKIGSYSGGQKARIALIAVMLIEPHVLLLDEPTNHLDRETIGVLIEALNEYEGGVVTITHDINLIQATESILLQMTDGEIFETDYETYQDEILTALS